VLITPEKTTRVVEAVTGRALAVNNFRGRHMFIDRSRGSDRLLMVLAGYKPHLWDITLARLARHVPADVDVCVVAPAVRPPALLDIAERHGWSLLSTRANYLALAQNLAIRAHRAARWVAKVDEDMFVGPGFYDALLDVYRHVQAEGRWWPGFVAPIINVNGYTYVNLLEELGLEQKYRERFGELIRASGQIPATNDPAAARWLWEHSLPFDDLVARFARRPLGYSTVPHKFNIGALLFAREFWERFGGFLVRPPAGALGMDETQICRRCVDLSRVMIVADNVFVGHFAFAAQDAAMREALPQLRPALMAA